LSDRKAQKSRKSKGCRIDNPGLLKEVCGKELQAHKPKVLALGREGARIVLESRQRDERKESYFSKNEKKKHGAPKKKRLGEKSMLLLDQGNNLGPLGGKWVKKNKTIKFR